MNTSLVGCSEHGKIEAFVLRALLPNLLWLALTLLLAQAVSAEPETVSSDQPPLSPPLDRDASAEWIHKIDRLIDQIHVGPSAGQCSDADFLRRVYLDLWGTIPSVDQARDFLQDSSSDKRAELVDKLLAAPSFARHMAYVFDVWLMERRNDKGVTSDEWQDYLYQSFVAAKPFDELVRELLVADGRKGTPRARAKFLLDRNCDANSLARDVSRLFLGRDLQCAQCHDHPLVTDYHQREYYGMVSLVQRSYVFTDKQDGNTLYIGERAEGLPEYHSVFIEDDAPQLAISQVAGKVPIDVPLGEVENAYVVTPSGKTRGVPKFSMRAELAKHVTMNNAAFDKSIANRLWGHMFGRGIVEPVDMHHSENPPSHPELLDELAAAIRATDYNVGAFLALIAKTAAYQRSIEVPGPEQVLAAHDEIEQVRDKSLERIDQLKATLEVCETELVTAETARESAEETVHERLRSAETLRKELTKNLDDSRNKRQKFDEFGKNLEDARGKQSLVQEAAAKTKAALDKLPDDAQVKSASETLTAKVAELNESVTKLVDQRKDLETQLAELEKVRPQLHADLETAQQELDVARKPLRAAHQEWLERLERRDSTLARVALAKRRHKIAERLLHFSDLSVANAGSTEERDRSLNELDTDWTIMRAVATPRPLTPEQLAWSSWQATGQLEFDLSATQNEWVQKNPAPGNLDPTSKAEREARLKREVRRALVTRLSPTVNQFAQLFGGAAGQVQTDFYTTADQALFLANSNEVQNILKPRGKNLSARLLAKTVPSSIAEELYFSILSRAPSAEEQESVSTYLNQRTDQRQNAVRVLAWSLLTSAEFRFYR